MRLGIIGSGKIVPVFLECGRNFTVIELRIFCGTKRSIEKTQIIKEEFNIENAYSDIDEFLADDLDVVYIAVPNNLHF